MGNANDVVFCPGTAGSVYQEDLMPDAQGFAEIDEPEIERPPHGAPPRWRTGAGRGGTAG